VSSSFVTGPFSGCQATAQGHGTLQAASVTTGHPVAVWGLGTGGGGMARHVHRPADYAPPSYIANVCVCWLPTPPRHEVLLTTKGSLHPPLPYLHFAPIEFHC